jgi:hypothetical protein
LAGPLQERYRTKRRRRVPLHPVCNCCYPKIKVYIYTM